MDCTNMTEYNGTLPNNAATDEENVVACNEFMGWLVNSFTVDFNNKYPNICAAAKAGTLVNYKGKHSSGNSYNIGDVVSLDGEFYISEEDNNTDTPPSAKWLKMQDYAKLNGDENEKFKAAKAESLNEVVTLEQLLKRDYTKAINGIKIPIDKRIDYKNKIADSVLTFIKPKVNIEFIEGDADNPLNIDGTYTHPYIIRYKRQFNNSILRISTNLSLKVEGKVDYFGDGEEVESTSRVFGTIKTTINKHQYNAIGDFAYSLPYSADDTDDENNAKVMFNIGQETYYPSYQKLGQETEIEINFKISFFDRAKDRAITILKESNIVIEEIQLNDIQNKDKDVLYEAINNTADDPIKLVTWNIHFCNDASMSDTLNFIKSFLDINKGAVIALQEVPLPVYKNILLQDMYCIDQPHYKKAYSGVLDDDWDYGDAQYGYFTTGDLLVSDTPFDEVTHYTSPSVASDYKNYKSFIVARKNDVWYINVHPHHVDSTAEMQLNDLKSWILSADGLNAPNKLIIMGDFNITWADYVEQFANDLGLTNLVTGDTNPDVPNQIDFILYKGVSLTDGAVESTDLSDHYLVRGEKN